MWKFALSCRSAPSANFAASLGKIGHFFPTSALPLNAIGHPSVCGANFSRCSVHPCPVSGHFRGDGGVCGRSNARSPGNSCRFGGAGGVLHRGLALRSQADARWHGVSVQCWDTAGHWHRPEARRFRPERPRLRAPRHRHVRKGRWNWGKSVLRRFQWMGRGGGNSKFKT